MPVVLWLMSNNTRPETIIRWFSYAHLPEKMQPTSKIFAEMASVMLAMCPTNSAERTGAFRKLLEAKDCYVRASIENAEATSE